jgi:hypothetical protein
VLDERWSDDAEEIGEALRRTLSKESSIERVRLAEKAPAGRDPALERQLQTFGLADLPPDPVIAARIAYELGRAIAPTAFVESMPALLLLGLRDVGYGFEGDVPAALGRVALRDDTGVLICDLTGPSARSTAGDWLVRPAPAANSEHIGDPATAERMRRMIRLVDSARLIGAGDSVLQLSVAYAGDRVAGGRVIGAYQAVSHMLVNAAIALAGAELLLRKAAFTALEVAGGDGAPSAVFAALLRAKAVQAARLAATTSHQVMAGNGFTLEYDCQLFSRRIRSWSGRLAPPGPDLIAVARRMLDRQHREQVRWLWQNEQGVDIPDWAKVSDRPI